MQLSLRLSAIADLVTEGNRLVDVGCDHGYLPVYLIQEKKIPFAIAMGFRESALVAILIMVGSPTTVTCYIMAKNMGNDGVLSSSIIVMATLLSSVTLTFWIFLLKSMGLI